mgnify:CR=1 FL=1
MTTTQERDTFYITVLETRLVQARKQLDYWNQRRRGQVGNCISDQEHQTDALRAVQNLEYQIREARNGNHHS